MTVESDDVERLSPLDVIEEFIASEVGHHSPGMREQAKDLLDALREHGYMVVFDFEGPAFERPVCMCGEYPGRHRPHG